MIEPHPFLQMYVDRMARPEIERHAALHDMTPDELSGAVRERLKDVLSDTDLWLHVSPARLKASLETGVITNALQTAGERSFVGDWGLDGAVVEMLLNQRQDVLYHVQLLNTETASRRWFAPNWFPGSVFLRIDPVLKENSTFAEGGTYSTLKYMALFPDATYQDLIENKSWAFEMLARMIQSGADTEALFSELLSRLTYTESAPPIKYFLAPPVLNSPISNPNELSWSWGTRLGSGGQVCPLCVDLKRGGIPAWTTLFDQKQMVHANVPLGDYCRFVAQVPGLIPLSSVSEVFFESPGNNPDLQDIARQLGIPVRTG